MQRTLKTIPGIKAHRYHTIDRYGRGILLGGSLYEDTRHAYIQKNGMDKYIKDMSATPMLLPDENPLHYSRRTGLAGDFGVLAYGWQNELRQKTWNQSDEGKKVLDRLRQLRKEMIDRNTDSVDNRYRTWLVGRAFQGKLGDEMAYRIAESAKKIIDAGTPIIKKIVEFAGMKEAGTAIDVAKKGLDIIYDQLGIPSDLSDQASAQRIVSAIQTLQDNYKPWATLSGAEQSRAISQGFDPNKALAGLNMNQIANYPDPDAPYGSGLRGCGIEDIDSWLPDTSVLTGLTDEEKKSLTSCLINVSQDHYYSYSDTSADKQQWKDRLKEWSKNRMDVSNDIDGLAPPALLVKKIFSGDTRTRWAQACLNKALDTLNYLIKADDANPKTLQAFINRVDDYKKKLGVSVNIPDNMRQEADTSVEGTGTGKLAPGASRTGIRRRR